MAEAALFCACAANSTSWDFSSTSSSDGIEKAVSMFSNFLTKFLSCLVVHVSRVCTSTKSSTVEGGGADKTACDLKRGFFLTSAVIRRADLDVQAKSAFVLYGSFSEILIRISSGNRS